MKVDDTLILRTVVSFLFYLINVFTFYLLVRGHNLPGGGFIGGLGTALSVILLSFAIGVEAAQRTVRVDPVRIATVGLLIAVVSAMLPMVGGDAFLNQYNGKFDNVPLLGEVPVGTPLLFDIGVFFVVVGVTTKLIFVLARSLSGLTALENSERRRYATRQERPIEERGARIDEGPAEPAPEAEPESDEGRRPAP